MEEKRYLIEILLRAREQVAQVAQRATAALDNVTKAQDRLAGSSKKMSEANRQESQRLEQLRQAHIREKKALDDSADSLRKNADARRKEADAASRSLEELQKQARLERAMAGEKESRDRQEIATMRRKAAELDAFGNKQEDSVRKQISQLRKEAAVFDALAKEESATNRRRASELDLQIASRAAAVRDAQRQASVASRAVTEQGSASRKAASDIRGLESDLKRLGSTSDETANRGGRLQSVMRRLGVESRSGRDGVRGLNSEFQGFQVALFIKYIQSIITAVVGLAGQLFAVGAAAVQAGAAIAGALAAGAAQAVPVIGVLGAALLRVKNVLQAVKLQNQQQLTATKDATTAAKAQRTAAEQIASAQQAVADAHRNVARAQENATQVAQDSARQEAQAQRDVTQARKDAIRTVQDLIDAEKQAQLSVEGAQQSLRQAARSGDVLGVAQAQLGLQQAQTGRTRARQDAAPVRARGIQGVPAFRDAERRLADTRRQNARQEVDAARNVTDAQRTEQRAEQNLNQVRRDSADNIAQETAAADKLKDSLARLSPAERELYSRIIRLQDVYKRATRPITDIIIRSFSGVVSHVISVLQDPRLQRAFRGLATQISSQINQALNFTDTRQNRSFIVTMIDEARRNMPRLTHIFENAFTTIRNLVLDALPAFRLLLRYVDGYTGRLSRWVGAHSRDLGNFFKDGIKYAKSFFDLGLAVVNLLLAIAGPGGAANQGRKTIDGLTGSVNELTRKVRSHAGQVRKFFSDTAGVLSDVISVIGSIAVALFNAFNPESVHALADFLNKVIIPAFSSAVTILGGLVNLFHILASLPGVSTFLQIAATMLILGKGLSVISEAITSLTGILPALLVQFGLLDAAVAEGGFFAAIGALGAGGWIVVAILAVVAAVVLLDKKFHFLGPTFKWLKGVAVDVFNALKSAGQSVLSWMSDVWTQGLLYWIRYPFVKLFQLVPWDVVGGAIKDAFNAVLGFFTNKQRGGWAILQDVLLAPFRFFGKFLGQILSLALLPIRVFLDVLAGRWGAAFDAIKGVFSGFLDFLLGGFTTILGVLQKVVDFIASFPNPLRGAARAAGSALQHARDDIDGFRESLRSSGDQQSKTSKIVQDSAQHTKTLRNRYRDAKDQLDILTPGTDAYKNAVKRADKAHQDLNDDLRITRSRAKSAAGPIGTLGANVSGLGFIAYDTAASVKDDLNAILKNIGSKPIKVSLSRHRTAAQQITGTDNPLLGSPFPRAYGGYASPFGGSSADDHILLSPMGVPVAAMSGTEGILNAPQMAEAGDALAIKKALGLGRYGSLGELWGSGMRHYQTGGGLHWDGHPQLSGAIARAVGAIERRFPGLSVTSTTDHSLRSSTGGISLHSRGLATDLSSGDYGLMNRAAAWIKRTMGRSLLEGIHNPNLSIKNGQTVPPSFWAQAWGQHLNHIHIALSRLAGGLGGLATRVRTPQFTGLQGSGVIGDVARGGARRLSRAANAYLARVMAAQGGGDRSGAKALGADANVVAGFRRAMRVMRANPTERLAGWEAGIVESGLKNLHYGDADSLGSLQERASIFGRAHALNPFASMVRFLRDAESRRPWRGSAGMLAAAVQRPRADLRGRYDAVRGQAMRYMQRGGALTGRISATPFSTPQRLRPGAAQAVIGRIQDLMSSVNDALSALSTRRLRRVKDLGKAIRGAFVKLTEDGGVFDQMSNLVESIATRGATRLQELQFRVGRRGPRRVARTPAQQARDQLGVLRDTRTGLVDEQTALESGLAAAQRALHVAQRRHNRRAAAQARAAIANLRTRLDKNRTDLAQNAQDQVEAVESYQSALADAVNNHAQAVSSHLDRLTRLAQLGGQTNFGAIGGILGQRQGVLATQISGLQGVLAQARRSGNVDLVNSLVDQIDELTTQMRENTQAIRDNTEAAFNARTQQIQQQASFATGIFGSAQSFFQALGQSLGVDTTGQQRTALQGTAGALSAAQTGLKGQLAALLGYSPQEAAGLQNLTGGDLVNYVMSLASGPAFQSIMHRLDPTQQASFQDLLQALIDNATATQQNTDAVNQLTGAQSQSFTSSFWSAFRVAVFNGAGGLLPQYQMTVPSAAVGARVLASGAMMVHAGEHVRPASVARDLSGAGGGDTINMNITSPTEVFDPTDAARQFAFRRRLGGRR